MSKLNIDYSEAICYSGFREGQSPETGVFPTYEEIKEDLLLLEPRWKYIRLYDCDQHTEVALEVIRKENLDIKVMLGVYINAEVNNSNCPWGGVHSEETLAKNKVDNEQKIKRVIDLANEYSEIVAWISAGNEATVEWTDHMVSVERVIHFVQQIQEHCNQPVTFCENYVTWLEKLAPLAEVVDFVSIHTYPVWEYKSIDEAMEYTMQNYYAVAEAYPNKTIVITEAGWTTKSNGRGIEPHQVNEEFQKIYFDQLIGWSKDSGTITFVFEAFDESWKGSEDALEPEKHWGIYNIDRSPKLVMNHLNQA